MKDHRNLEINRRQAMQTGLLTAASLTAASSRNAQAASRGGRPNILMLMVDQFRGDCLGSDGHPAIQTPHLDRIAAEGARFRCAYSCTPTCTPARAALLTGLAPWHHGMLGYSKVAERYPYEMPRVLRDAGYYTLGIGKMHYAHQRNTHGFHKTILDESGREQSPGFRSDYRSWFFSQAPTLNPDATGIGWNDYDAKPYALPERLHPTVWTGSTAVNFINNYKRKEPFFLKVSFARPHSPYDPPRRFFDLYQDADIPEAVVGDWAERHAERGKKLPSSTWRGDLGKAQVRKSRQGYYGSITFIDEQVGRIMDALEKQNQLENTLILFTADHGDMTGDHHLWRKSYAYEASARIPMLVRWPQGMLSAKRGQTLTQPAEIRDVFPTFLHAASIGPERQLDGESLLKPIQGETEGWRDCIDLEHDVCYSPDNHWNALCNSQFKYIFHAKSGEEQLFDLERDPNELKDLAGDPSHRKILREWRDRMIEHLSERGEAFVKNGKLALRPKRMLHSPHYPKPSAG